LGTNSVAESRDRQGAEESNGATSQIGAFSLLYSLTVVAPRVEFLRLTSLIVLFEKARFNAEQFDWSS
jgi:hypothetical protein